jgi:hypothetical protein
VTDYGKLIEEAREYVDALQGGENSNWMRLVALADLLADAVEALTAACEDLIKIAQEANDDCKTLLSERVIQLDSMTEEWGWKHDQGFVACRNETDARRRYVEGVARDERRQYQARGKNRVIRRLVSPWVEVEGDKSNE